MDYDGIVERLEAQYEEAKEMRHETSLAAMALHKCESYRGPRTKVTGDAMYLHGNKIAWKLPDGSVCFCMCGWGTPTTRERLNGVYEVFFDARPFHQKDGKQYYGEQEIDTKDVIRVRDIKYVDPEEFLLEMV